eukprot:219448-Pelagomonas_calceolata.AAC.1
MVTYRVVRFQPGNRLAKAVARVSSCSSGRMNSATSKMARNFMGGIARIQNAGAVLGISNRKRAVPWLFQ